MEVIFHYSHAHSKRWSKDVLAHFLHLFGFENMHAKLYKIMQDALLNAPPPTISGETNTRPHLETGHPYQILIL